MKSIFKINLGLLSSSLYLACNLIANILSTKITLLPFINLAIDGGTIIYPLTFTLRDLVHKTLGKQSARQLIIIAGLANALMFFLFWLIGIMAPDPAWPYQKAYQQILLPVGRVILASVIAQIISELIDTEIFSIFYKKINEIGAVLLSNLAGLIVDSFIFSLIAFLGSLPFSTVLEIIIANILIKLIISVISSPAIKLVPRMVKHEEI